MKNLGKTLQALKDQLLFVREGRFRLDLRARLIFEDSPPRTRFCVPRDGLCADEVCSDKQPFRGRSLPSHSFEWDRRVVYPVDLVDGTNSTDSSKAPLSS